MNFNRKLGLAAITTIAVVGCAPVDPGFGEALRYDMAVQTVDPDPVYSEGGAQPGDSGAKAAKASEAYRKGTTKSVSTLGTQQSGGGPQ